MLSTEQHTLNDLMCNSITMLLLLLLNVSIFLQTSFAASSPHDAEESSREFFKGQKGESDACSNWNFPSKRNARFCWQVTPPNKQAEFTGMSKRMHVHDTHARLDVPACTSTNANPSLRIGCHHHIYLQTEISIQGNSRKSTCWKIPPKEQKRSGCNQTSPVILLTDAPRHVG